jgi:L-methionine (R)-S-oxide reductase
MAEDLILTSQDKKARYEELLPQLKALCFGEDNNIANLANIAAGLKEAFGFFWVGFYLVDSPNELVLGPFQGPVACTRITKGKGVCGSSWEQNAVLLVPDVEQFPGHIACSSLSKSEIVVPIHTKNGVIGVLDVDSDVLNDFDETDQRYLTELCEWIGSLYR